MCFGKKPYYDASTAGARPSASHIPQQTYTTMPEAKNTSSPPPQQATYMPPPGPPPQLQQHSQQSAPTAASTLDYAPPPGPPPGHGQQHSAAAPTSDYAPPPGPPPSHNPAGPAGAAAGTSNNTVDYAPPPGPPPAFDYTTPPPGPPPSHAAAAQAPQHDWQSVVPDTSLFPPPPDIFSGWERSPANNATEEEMEAGEAWCAQHPLSAPLPVGDPAARAVLASNDPRLMKPVGFRGSLTRTGRGVWEVRTTDRRARDTCVVAFPPLYAAGLHSPLATGRAKTVYYEVAVRADSRAEETSLALGFAALPYPSFRLPGWHRASLAVHGDDGHRYTNDLTGGHSFTAPFRRGERYGIGMTFTPVAGKLEVEVFFTRQGRKEGSWDLHEETDVEQEGGVEGLEGFHDLSCALGTFSLVSFEVIFDPERWLYKGVQV